MENFLLFDNNFLDSIDKKVGILIMSNKIVLSHNVRVYFHNLFSTMVNFCHEFAFE